MNNPWNLSPAEEQVIDLLSCGSDSKKIAVTLGVCRRTVQNACSLAAFKMGCPGNAARAAVLWDRFAMGRTEEST